jgi:hypothetical protein
MGGDVLMSISKPQLKNPWATSGSANMEDPGGVNETGYPIAALGPPRKWFNWILNKIETVGRYLVARGIPDYDPNESYSVGDRVQWGGSTGMTFVCTIASVGDGSYSNSPGVAHTKWGRWARGVPDYNALSDYWVNDTVIDPYDGCSYICIQINSPGLPKSPHSESLYWRPWGHTDDQVVDLIHQHSNLEWTTTSTGISITSGSVSDVIDLRFSDGITELPARDLSFSISDASNGYIDVTLGSPIAFSVGIKSRIFIPTCDAGANPVYVQPTGNNTMRIHCSRDNGPGWSGYVRLLGY